MTYEDLKVVAGKCCIDIYMSIHVSELPKQGSNTTRAWQIGKELYELQNPNRPKPMPQTKSEPCTVIVGRHNT